MTWRGDQVNNEITWTQKLHGRFRKPSLMISTMEPKTLSHWSLRHTWRGACRLTHMPATDGHTSLERSSSPADRQAESFLTWASEDSGSCNVWSRSQTAVVHWLSMRGHLPIFDIIMTVLNSLTKFCWLSRTKTFFCLYQFLLLGFYNSLCSVGYNFKIMLYIF